MSTAGELFEYIYEFKFEKDFQEEVFNAYSAPTEELKQVIKSAVETIKRILKYQHSLLTSIKAELGGDVFKVTVV